MYSWLYCIVKLWLGHICKRCDAFDASWLGIVTRLYITLISDTLSFKLKSGWIVYGVVAFGFLAWYGITHAIHVAIVDTIWCSWLISCIVSGLVVWGCMSVVRKFKNFWYFGKLNNSIAAYVGMLCDFTVFLSSFFVFVCKRQHVSAS